MTVAFTHANIILTDHILEDANLIVQDGRIVAFGPCQSTPVPDGATILDADHGMYLMPGLIDTHNDGLENEINPRPRAALPSSFALHNYERRALAAGVTTSFHAITFANMARSERTIQEAADRTETVRGAAAGASMDHQVLHRLDVWTPAGMEPLFDSMRRCDVQAVSLNDHTPGQGQYRDIEGFKKTLEAYRANDPSFDAQAEIERRIAERSDDTTTLPAVYARVVEEYRRAPFILASHDDDSAEKVEMMHDLGATVAEFPITNEAAARARELGMWITVGAPNIVRGGSTSGNSDAAELAGLGLADIICADYHSPSMLLSVFRLVERGLCSLPAAVKMVTANPAAAFGLADRGRIEVGLSADLALVEMVQGQPVVQAVTYRGRPVFANANSLPRSKVLTA
ncbi:MAG: alpha-D-ribose 1-methylphosphonate 5-triphosphate diphosphatase [Chloroflexi bacterium HGW-Chloroflexi-9]|nr:MAG: alpha-D-ribose 1-methylphosphonate 5-triphosphate diphosphatase [Chloroflexi bacterium HGW-Chloroflexi-9]